MFFFCNGANKQTSLQTNLITNKQSYKHRRPETIQSQHSWHNWCFCIPLHVLVTSEFHPLTFSFLTMMQLLTMMTCSAYKQRWTTLHTHPAVLLTHTFNQLLSAARYMGVNEQDVELRHSANDKWHIYLCTTMKPVKYSSLVKYNPPRPRSKTAL